MSGFSALKAFETAFTKTKKLLFEPFDPWVWVKLIVIALLAGAIGNGGGSNASSSYSAGDGGSTSGLGSYISDMLSDSNILLIIAIAIIMLFLLILFMAYLKSVFNFVLVKAVTSGDVKIIRPALDNWLTGLKVFLLDLALGIGALLVILIPILIFIFLLIGVAGLIDNRLLIVLAIMLLGLMLAFLISISLLVIIFTGIARGFTYDFVIPIMMFKGKGLIAAWNDLWDTVKKNLPEFVVYAFARFIASIVIGLIVLLLMLPFLILLILFILLMVMLYLIAASITPVLGIPVIIGAALVAGLFLALMLCIAMPVAVYFRYYTLDFLKALDPAAVTYSERFSA